MSEAEAKLPNGLGAISDLYEKSLREHGATPKGVGWKDESSHKLRFEKLVQAIDLKATPNGISVNDLGCGYGALFRYLDEMPSIELAHYYGYDVNVEMLDTARRLMADPRAEFIQSAHATRVADYSFVSGTYNVRLETTDELWTEYVKESLLGLAERSTRGFAFNILTTYVDWKQDNLYYADPFVYFDFCRQNISRYVSLLHDYPLFEWTMIVRKEEYLR